MLTLKVFEKVVFYTLCNMQQSRKQISLCLENQQIKITGKALGQSPAVK